MRILIYAINYSPEQTGTGKYTGALGDWLGSRHHEVRVITAPPYYPGWRVKHEYRASRYRREASGGGVTVWRCPLWVPKRPTGAKRLVHLGSFAASSCPVALAHATWRPDLVFAVAPTLFSAPAALLLARLARAKCWLHIQDFEVDAAFNLGMLRSSSARRAFLAAERLLLTRFDRVSSISERMVDRLDEKGVPKARRVLFPNWADLSLIRPLGTRSAFRADLGLSEPQVVALYAGNLGEKQGLEIMIEAARMTAGARELVWVIAGAGTARARLEALSSGCHNLRWLPLQSADRLNELLNLADIHVLPQRAGAADLVMPSKLTNMLASGRPVVAAAAAGTQVAAVVGGRGTVVPPGDADRLARAVEELAGNPARRRELGAAARRYAEEFLDRDRIMRGFERAAEALVAADGRRP